jgi:hypothetical protein
MERMSVPDPVTVWMVHLDRTVVNDDVKGTLEVEEDVLAFTASHGRQPTGFPFDAIVMAKRLRGSPVLMIEWRHAGEIRRTAFYFTEPPPMPSKTGRPSQDSWDDVPDRPNPFKAFRNSKRRNMRVNGRYLSQASVGHKELIQSWADEVSARIGSVR